MHPDRVKVSGLAGHPSLLREPFEQLFTCRERFPLFANAGFLVVLTLFDFREYSRFLAFPLEALQGIFEAFILADLDQRHGLRITPLSPLSKLFESRV